MKYECSTCNIYFTLIADNILHEEVTDTEYDGIISGESYECPICHSQNLQQID